MIFSKEKGIVVGVGLDSMKGDMAKSFEWILEQMKKGASVAADLAPSHPPITSVTEGLEDLVYNLEKATGQKIGRIGSLHPTENMQVFSIMRNPARMHRMLNDPTVAVENREKTIKLYNRATKKLGEKKYSAKDLLEAQAYLASVTASKYLIKKIKKEHFTIVLVRENAALSVLAALPGYGIRWIGKAPSWWMRLGYRQAIRRLMQKRESFKKGRALVRQAKKR